MYPYITQILFVIIFSTALLLISLVLGMRIFFSKNKNTTFECGFDTKDSARLPFSMRFFLLTVIFLIFDIEVALIFPLLLGLKLSTTTIPTIAGLIFLIILMLGLVHEWKQGSLSWVQ